MGYDLNENVLYRINDLIIQLNSLNDRINEIEKTLERIDQNLYKKIKLTYDGKVVFFHPNDVIYCEGDGNYCNIFFVKGKKVLLTKKLKQVEDLLPEPHFYRVHNSYIVNLDKIKAFIRNEGILIMENNVNIPVSRNKRSNIIDKVVF